MYQLSGLDCKSLRVPSNQVQTYLSPKRRNHLLPGLLTMAITNQRVTSPDAEACCRKHYAYPVFEDLLTSFVGVLGS